MPEAMCKINESFEMRLPECVKFSPETDKEYAKADEMTYPDLAPFSINFRKFTDIFDNLNSLDEYELLDLDNADQLSKATGQAFCLSSDNKNYSISYELISAEDAYVGLTLGPDNNSNGIVAVLSVQMYRDEKFYDGIIINSIHELDEPTYEELSNDDCEGF